MTEPIRCTKCHFPLFEDTAAGICECEAPGIPLEWDEQRLDDEPDPDREYELRHERAIEDYYGGSAPTPRERDDAERERRCRGGT